MKPISVSGVITFVVALLLTTFAQGQSFGTSASAVWISDCNGSDYYNTSGLIGPATNVFTNKNFGTHTQNSGTLILRGGEVRTFKTPGVANVCSVQMYYRIYLQSAVAGSFNGIDLPLVDNCNVPTNLFPSGGSCVTGDQKWNLIIADGTTTPYAPVDLTQLAAGNYVLEVYYDVKGSSTTTTLCDETKTLNNSGSNYKAFFSIQSPDLSSANPVTCNGSEGFITISGLTPNAAYAVSYTNNGNPVGPINMTANSSGQIIITNLKAGLYSDFEIDINGCATTLNKGLILSNPVIIPKFNKIAAFCAGSVAPTLPTTSTNGINGTWSPSVIDNQNSGSYTFTPSGNQCGIPITINVTVNPKQTPVFSFGTSLPICAGGSVPTLPTTSTNAISGTWSPSVVDNQNSKVYTFTPTGGQCANSTTFSVTVTPNITPTFNFDTSLTICAGNSVPALPTTSNNGVSGTWNPSTVDDQNSGTYTFTPTAGQCATTTTFNVTVKPNVTPVFSFGPSSTICAGASVPSLPTTSDNGIAGTWNPATVDNQNSGVYTFTPSAGVCALPVTFSVTVNPNITPAFSFSTSLTICAGGSVPSLPNTSTNGITGSWSPSIVDNQNSGTYSFTPDPGQCALTTSFTVTVNPNITPVFSFGPSSTICAGGSVPSLPTTSDNGISGTWSPSAIDNQNSGNYIFTPTAGQCAVSTSFAMTVNPIVTPTFSFSSSLSICAGSAVPTLPVTSTNGIAGSWNPSTVDNQNSGTYTFTPSSGQCATTATFTVTVNPVVTPTFGFVTSLSVCAGGTVPTLTNTSSEGITGTWNPSTVDNQNSGTYTFTPDAGQCANSTTLTVTVNPNVTPTFGFGTSQTICQGSGAPNLPKASTNGINGTWNPSLASDQNSGTYTFTPDAGQCATTTNFTLTVTPTTVPVFSFGPSLVICAGGSVPVLPTTSNNGITGTWSPAIADNQASAIYTFTPDPVPGQCIATARFIITVNPVVTPTFGFGSSLAICTGAAAPILPTTSDNGITGTWNPSVVSNQSSAAYTFTPNAGQCATGAITLTVTVTPVATVDFEPDTTVNDGSPIPNHNLTGSPAGVSFNWSNSNPAIGLSSSGSGSVPAFIATNKSSAPISGTITITPMLNGCAGTPGSYVIKVIPLDKEVFVPNVFSPNGDGKNDILYVYSNYIKTMEMRIFNQWGQQVELITDPKKGWNGSYKGSPQPVGVYVYILKAVLTDGRSIQLKGNITLLR